MGLIAIEEYIAREGRGPIRDGCVPHVLLRRQQFLAPSLRKQASSNVIESLHSGVATLNESTFLECVMVAQA